MKKLFIVSMFTLGALHCMEEGNSKSLLDLKRQSEFSDSEEESTKKRVIKKARIAKDNLRKTKLNFGDIENPTTPSDVLKKQHQLSGLLDYLDPENNQHIE